MSDESPVLGILRRMPGYYATVARRAVLFTVSWAREHIGAVILMMVAAVIASPILTLVLPISGKARQNIIDTLTSDYWAEAVVGITLIVLGGAVTLIVNFFRLPVQMHRESSQTIQRLSEELASERQYIDQLLISPEHITSLKQVLSQLPQGPPGDSPARTYLYDQLREHLSDSTIWVQAERLRELIAQASDGEQAAQRRLWDEIRAFKLLELTGPSALLTRRLHGVLHEPHSEFPDEPWFVEDRHLLKLGRDYGMAEVHSFGEAELAVNNIIHLWNAIPSWPEVKRVIDAQAQTPEARDILGLHIVELMQRPSLPGRCRICRREPLA